MEHLAVSNSLFTNRVNKTAVALVLGKDMTLAGASKAMWQKYHVHVPPTTLHDWVTAKTRAPTQAAG